jgi:hypothetical protein
MKNSLVKIIGVVMTVAILAGLLVMSLPASVSAADLTWSTLNSPTMTVGTNANVYAFGPDGKTLYLYSAGVLNKSLDGGNTWTTTGLGAGLPTNVVLTKIAVDQASASYLVATDGSHVYRSNDAGADWYAFDPSPTPAGTITSVDITNGSSGAVDIVAGYKNDFSGAVAYFDTNNGVWQITGAALGSTSWGTADAEAVMFSPTFASDLTIMAVAGNSTSIVLRSYIVATGAKWNGDVADGIIPSMVASPTTIASIAVASDFVPGSASTGKVFVGIGNTSGAAGDVYRMNGRAQNSVNTTLTSPVYSLGLGTDVASIAFTGPVATGTLIAADYSDSIIYNATSVSTVTSGATWNASAQAPRAGATPNTLVKFAPTTTTLYAGTGGGIGSALSTSTDYNSFAGIAFVSVSGFDKISFPSGGWTGAGGTSQWLKTYDSGNAGGTYTLWHSTDSGTTWKEVFEDGSINFSVSLSPAYATDKTIYLIQYHDGAAFLGGTAINKLVKSVDGGLTWSTVPVIGAVAPTALAAIDTNNYWIGSTAGVEATNTATTVYLDGNSPVAIIALPGAMLVWEYPNGEFWYSTDSGVTFKASGAASAIGFIGAFTFGFDGTHWTIYAVDSTNNIEKFQVGVDTAWSVYDSVANIVGTTTGFINLTGGYKLSSLSLAPGGVWYITSVGNTTAQIWRSTDLNTWEPVPGLAVATSGTIATGPITAVKNAAGNNVLYAIVNGIGPTPSVAPYYGPRLESFTDAVLAGPKITAPAAGTSIPSIVDITWAAVPYATQYDVQVAYDSAFTNLVPVGANNATTATTAGTILSQVSLVGGKTYYVRVRVSGGKPLASAWATAVSFTTQLSSTGSLTTQGLDTVGRIYPTNGSVVTAANPSFTWGQVAGATSYDFKLSDKADFSTTIDSTTGLTGTVYLTTVTLKPGAYFWEVRAVNGTVTSNWVQNSFTIAGAATTTPGAPGGITTVTIPAITVPTPNITVPPAQVTVNNPTPNITVNTGTSTTSTPAWTWVLIVIGAVLVIAVIVLIVRTRRI